jgi:hypothetical protein
MNKMNRRITFSGALLAVSAALLAGCSREEIKVYTVPKEKSAAPMVAAAQGQAPASSAPAKPSIIAWDTPKDWQELPGNSVRLGSFSIQKSGKKAEVAITTFPGSVGGELENWNRWRGEIGLAPTDAQAIQSEQVQVGPDEGKLYDLSGTAARTVVAVVLREGASWFFKLRGDATVVADARPEFLEFLKTIRFTGKPSNRDAVMDAGQPPKRVQAGTDPHAGLNPDADPHAGIEAGSRKPAATKPVETVEDSAVGEPKWNVPSTWQAKAPTPMVLKSYTVADDAGHSAAVAISVFPGTVGGTVGNINRWRGQLGLPPIESDEVSKQSTTVDVEGGGRATLVDFKGTDAKTGKPARLVAAIVPQGDQTWFYKLTGDDAVVGREKEAFTKFVQTVRY